MTIHDQMMMIGIDGPLLRSYSGAAPEEALARALSRDARTVRQIAHEIQDESRCRDRRQFMRVLLSELHIRMSAAQLDQILRLYLRESASVRPRQPGVLTLLNRLRQEFVLATWPGRHPMLSEIAIQNGLKSPEIDYFALPYSIDEGPASSLSIALQECDMEPENVVFAHANIDEVEAAERLGAWGYLLDPEPSYEIRKRAEMADFEIIASLQNLPALI